MIPLAAIQQIPEELPEVDLPGGVAPFLRAFFSVPRGVQMAGGIAAALVALVLLVVIIRKRESLLSWFRSRSRVLQLGLAGAGAAALVLVAAGGTVSWNYMQHDNDFCTGCHVMEGAFRRFTESGHAELNCHDCHRQSIFASMRQLHLWVTDRPQEIGEHSPVPTAICAECHINDDPAENWPQIAATAGHLTHLESDSSALADVQCVTCHGQEVHEFNPADQTCAQANCHATEATQIVLGGMTGEAGLHCVTCHEFTAEPVAPARVDSVGGLLTPGLSQCTSCHEMEDLWADYDPLVDPHDARCGACHNPHEQETPELALRSCTDAGCHARPDTLSTFHIGLGELVEENCTSCHEPHTWVRDGNDCASCHADILGQVARASGGNGGSGSGRALALGSPQATSSGPRIDSPHGAVARGRDAPAEPVAVVSAAEAGAFRHLPAETRGRGPSAPEDAPFHAAPTVAPGSVPAPRAAVTSAAAQQQAFSHRQHANVGCTECHSNRNRHGEVTVRTQTDCFECHHATRTAGTQGCGRCHAGADLARVRSVTTTMRFEVGERTRVRALPFDHGAHDQLRCVDCHGGGTRQRVQASCSACHEDHHASDATASCATCHEEHREDAHTAAVHTDGCTGSGCHTEPRYDRMAKTREFCAVCHQDMIDHEVAEPCMNCHLVPDDPASRRGNE